jgi:cytochrome c oxidase cbb3-type subunit 3
MRTITQVGFLTVSAAGVVFLLSLAAHSSGSSLLSGSHKDADASALLAKNCATCHGNDGQAKTFKANLNHARNLTDSAWQANVSDERLFNSIVKGRGHMPAWGKKLTEAEINSLVAYVRQLKKRSNHSISFVSE